MCARMTVVFYCLVPIQRRLGYPTQKPQALLDCRIIEASSNEGDVVLDPESAAAARPYKGQPRT